MRRVLPFFVAFAALVAFADEPPPFVTGLLPNAPGKEIRVRTLASARRSPLPRSTPDELPAYWNSASNGWVTSVKDQRNLGNCWAFAALATIETYLLKSGRGEYDFSEKNMAKLSAMVGYSGDGAYAYSPEFANLVEQLVFDTEAPEALKALDFDAVAVLNNHLVTKERPK